MNVRVTLERGDQPLRKFLCVGTVDRNVTLAFDMGGSITSDSRLRGSSLVYERACLTVSDVVVGLVATVRDCEHELLQWIAGCRDSTTGHNE